MVAFTWPNAVAGKKSNPKQRSVRKWIHVSFLIYFLLVVVKT